MTIRNLEKFFTPRSVAVIGASARPHSVGATVLANLRASFTGSLWAVNPRHAELAGIPCHADVNALPAPPDLAVVCTPAATVPDIIARLGARGCRAAVVITGGLNGASPQAGASLAQRSLEAARPHGLRIIGPNCLGLLVPALGVGSPGTELEFAL